MNYFDQNSTLEEEISNFLSFRPQNRLKLSNYWPNVINNLIFVEQFIRFMFPYKEIQNSRFSHFRNTSLFSWNLMKITKITLYGVVSFALYVLNAKYAVHTVGSMLIHRHNPLLILYWHCASLKVYMSFISYYEQNFKYS